MIWILLLLLNYNQSSETQKCYSLQDVLDAKCEVACAREGYNSGKYSERKCECTDQYEAERITGKKLKLPRRQSNNSLENTIKEIQPKQGPFWGN